MRHERAVTPTRDEWADFRKIISALYRKYKLEVVRVVMAKVFNFHASKRMYKKRLKDWEVFKYQSRRDPQRSTIYTASDAISPNDDSRDTPILSIESELHAALAYAKSMARLTPSALPQATKSSSTGGRHSSRSSNDGSFSSRLAPCLSPQSHGSTALSSPDIDGRVILTPEGSPANGAEHDSPLTSDMRAMAVTSVPRDSQTLTFSHDSLEKITSNIDAYYLGRVKYGSQLEPQSSSGTGVDSTFWRLLDDGIYDIKSQSHRGPQRRGFDAVMSACDMVADLVRKEPINFLHGLLTTLASPNHRVLPNLRSTLLSHIALTATKCLGPKHPISIISFELFHNPDVEVSRRALLCTRDCARTLPGNQQARIFRITKGLITLSRRNGELDQVEKEARDFVHMSIQFFGERSLEARKARRELAHVLMDQAVLDDTKWLEAESLELESLIRVPDVGEVEESTVRCEVDEQAKYSMEDLAKIADQGCNILDRVHWLQEALKVSTIIDGESSAEYARIAGKLIKTEEVLAEGGKYCGFD